MKPKAVRLLSALCAGLDVKLPDGFTIRRVGGRVVYVAHRDPGGEEVFIGCDMTLDRFLEVAEQMPEEELFRLGAQKALTEMHAERWR